VSGGAGTNDKREVMSSITWNEVVLTAAPAVTPKEGEKSPGGGTGSGGTGDGGAGDEHLRKLLRVHRMDPRPTFLYFHHPHEDVEKPGAAGKASRKLCRMLAEEAFARWGLLVRCFEVDAEKSDAKVLERLGAGDGPSFAIVDENLAVVARSGSFVSAKTAAAFVRDAVTTKFPAYWKSVAERVEEQRKLVAEARTLAKQKKFDQAVARYDAVVWSELRIGDFFDDACKEWVDATKEKQRAEGR
jgi:hypothetical protein